MNCTITVPASATAAETQPAQTTEQPTPAACPPWCTRHLAVTDAGSKLHISAPSEVAGVVITAERFDVGSRPAEQLVNITALDKNLTAAEARLLAATLCFYAATVEGATR